MKWEKLLVRDRNKGREPAHRLRKAMLEAGFKHECEVCGLPPKWKGKELVLQIDHFDGDTKNNSPENIRFICPNCHAQTLNFGSKNRNRLGELGIDELYMWGLGDEYECE